MRLLQWTEGFRVCLPAKLRGNRGSSEIPDRADATVHLVSALEAEDIPMRNHTSKWDRHRRDWFFVAILMMSYEPRMYGQTPGDSDGDGPKIHSATALGDIFFKSRNSLIFALGAHATAQDNVLFTDADQKTFDTTAALFGRIAYQRQYQKTSFGLDYSLGVVSIIETTSTTN